MANIAENSGVYGKKRGFDREKLVAGRKLSLESITGMLFARSHKGRRAVRAAVTFEPRNVRDWASPARDFRRKTFHCKVPPRAVNVSRRRPQAPTHGGQV